jgi:plasmid stability protein
MNTLTLTGISDELQRKLTERAAASRRSIEEEALCCLRLTLETEEAILNSIPEDRWKEVEQSLCDSIHDRGTPLTKADLQRYRDLARGRQAR